MVKIPEFTELKFDDKKHEYRLNGLIIPSVTTVMKPLSNEYYNGVNEELMDKAAKRGTAVHNAIENFLKFDVEDIEPEFDGYFGAFAKWWSDKAPEALGVESRVYHKCFGYAGTADLPCVIDGVITCVDFKTSASIAEMLVRVQLEAYAQAFDSHGVSFGNKAIVQLKKDGTYKEQQYPAGDLKAWKTFGALLTMHGYLNEYRR